MTIVYGFLATEATNRDAGILSTLERGIDAPGVARFVFDEPAFVLKVRATETAAATTARGTTRDGAHVALVGRPLSRADLAQSIANLDSSQVADSVREIDGYWLAFVYGAARKSLEVLCDRLGVAWLYWSQVPGGIAFSSDFGALASALPKHPRLNEGACLQMLTVTYPLDDATCFEEIRLVSPDSALVFREGRVSRTRLRAPEYGDRWAGASQAAKFEALEAALDASYAAWSGPGTSSWTVALSSGKDSRYGLGVLLRHGQRPACATFGLPGSTDVRGAVAICRREGLRHELFNPNRRTSWQSWIGAVQRLGVVAGYQYGAGWAHDWRRTLEGLDGQVVLGSLGDALSGMHLVDRFAGDWLANWEAWALGERDDGTWAGSDMLRAEVRDRTRGLLRASFVRAWEGATFALEHQKGLHLDLLCRQRRATASQINFLSDAVPVGPLLYTRAMIDFWSNLGYEDLRGQSLYLDYARARFPTLFAPARPPSLLARARGTTVNAIVAAVPSLRARLAPPEIDVGAQVAQHLDRLRALVREYGDVVSKIVDLAALNGWIDGFSARGGLKAGQLQRFWNLLLLVEAGMGDRDPATREAQRAPQRARISA
jgi:hypothetical protein